MAPLYVETDKGKWYCEGKRWCERDFWVESGEKREITGVRGVPKVVLKGEDRGGRVFFDGKEVRVGIKRPVELEGLVVYGE